MTHEEIVRAENAASVEAREENRRYRTLCENAEARHAELVRNEKERYALELRKLRIEHETRIDAINARKDECRIAYAQEKDKAEAAASQDAEAPDNAE